MGFHWKHLYWCYFYILECKHHIAVVICVACGELHTFRRGSVPVRNNVCLQLGKHPLLTTESTQGCPYMELNTASGLIGSLTSKPEHADFQLQITWEHLLRLVNQRDIPRGRVVLVVWSSHLLTLRDKTNSGKDWGCLWMRAKEL